MAVCRQILFLSVMVTLVSSQNCSLCPRGSVPSSHKNVGNTSCTKLDAIARETVTGGEECTDYQNEYFTACDCPCDLFEDTCPFPYQGDGHCKSAIPVFDPLYDADGCGAVDADCLDCSYCNQFSLSNQYTGKVDASCSECVANGCLWCAEGTLCYPPVPDTLFPQLFMKHHSCDSSSQWLSTCEQNTNNVYSDPLYGANRWIYEVSSCPFYPS